MPDDIFEVVDRLIRLFDRIEHMLSRPLESRQSMIKVGVVVPTFNEAKNLPRLVEGIRLSTRGMDAKIVIIDDNSPDMTAQVAEDLNKDMGDILVNKRPKKLGIGSAIRDGLEFAVCKTDAEYLITMDADLSHDPGAIPLLLGGMDGCDCVIGSRYVAGGEVVGWSLSRKVTSSIANNLSGLLLRTGLHDQTSNFRVYSRRCAQALIEDSVSSDYEWLIESVRTIKKHAFSIREVPIVFANRKHGNSKLGAREIMRWMLFLMRSQP